MRHSLARLLLYASLAGLPVAAAAEQREVYVSEGEHGEPSFSDVAAPGAERLVVETSAPVEDPLAELDRRIQQSLTVANALEESRLAREEARAEARARAAEARAAAPPQVIYQDRYVTSPYLFPHTGHRRHDWRGGRHDDWRDGQHRPPHGRPDRPVEPPRDRSLSKAFPPRD